MKSNVEVKKIDGNWVLNRGGNPYYIKGAGGNVFKLNCLKELLYGKKNLENPYFVASKHGTSLYSSNLSW